jgi:hypothetical protein
MLTFGPFPPDNSTILPHFRRPRPISDRELAFAIWYETTGLSRTQYTSLRQVLSDNVQLNSLLERLNILEAHLKDALPLLELRVKPVSLDSLNQPTLSSGEKDTVAAKAENLFPFDSKNTLQAMSSSRSMGKRLHTRLGRFVDSPSELWYLRALMSSIWTISGRFAHHPSDQPALPSDSVHYACTDVSCKCTLSLALLHTGVIFATGIDKCTVCEHSKVIGSLCIQVQRLIPSSSLPFGLVLGPIADAKEFFLLEGIFHVVLETAVSQSHTPIWH